MYIYIYMYMYIYICMRELPVLSPLLSKILGSMNHIPYGGARDYIPILQMRTSM